MPDQEQANPPHAFLIMVNEILVGQDIAGAIGTSARTRGAEPQIIIATSFAEAEAALAELSVLALAFLQIPPAVFEGSSLAALIATRGGRSVLMGFEAENAVAEGLMGDWIVLPMPFTSEHILRLLRS